MFWLLPVGVLCFALWRLIAPVYEKGGNLVEEKWKEACDGFAIILGMLGLTLTIIGVVSTLKNGETIAQLKAFYSYNTVNYSIVVEKTASLLSTSEFENRIVSGSLEKLQQAGFVSEKISEWRTAVNQYNLDIATLKYYNDNIWTGVLVPDEIEDLRPLIIK